MSLSAAFGEGAHALPRSSGTDRGDADSTPVDTAGSESPHGIGLASDGPRGTDETGPEPIDTELEDEQVEGVA